tara:strand:+ start:98 stop:484 length:387 start_codon:yes stop_codon:yes gene_type:complete
MDELLEAVRAFLIEDAAPALDGRRRFHALVAANVVAIVMREMKQGEQGLKRELGQLWRLLEKEGSLEAAVAEKGVPGLAGELNRELCRLIDAGKADQGPWRKRLLKFLDATVERKLEVDNPGFDRTRL